MEAHQAERGMLVDVVIASAHKADEKNDHRQTEEPTRRIPHRIHYTTFPLLDNICLIGAYI